MDTENKSPVWLTLIVYLSSKMIKSFLLTYVVLVVMEVIRPGSVVAFIKPTWFLWLATFSVLIFILTRRAMPIEKMANWNWYLSLITVGLVSGVVIFIRLQEESFVIACISAILVGAFMILLSLAIAREKSE